MAGTSAFPRVRGTLTSPPYRSIAAPARGAASLVTPMPTAPKSVYHARVSGLWNTRHAISREEESGPVELGTLSVSRNLLMVTGGTFTPTEGEVLMARREPGLLRSQFSLWTDGREWLGSSLRRTTLKRQIDISSGSTAFRLLPISGLQMGWSLYAPKTGQACRVTASPLGRSAKIEVFRRLDFPLVIFSYFLGFQVYLESLAPGPEPEKVKAATAATAV